MSDEPVWTSHVRNWSGSVVLPLPRVIREHLCLAPADLVGFRKCGRYVMLKKLRPGEVMPFSSEEAARAAEEAKLENG